MSGIEARTDATTPTLSATIKGNTVRGTGTSWGIIVGSTTGTIQANFVADVSEGLGLFRSSMTVTGNTIFGNNPSGSTVLLEGGSNTLQSNRIDAGGLFAVQLLNTFSVTQANLIKMNTIVNSSRGVDGCGGPLVSGNTVTGNTIIDANVGIALPSGNINHPNTFDVVTTAVAPCS